MRKLKVTVVLNGSFEATFDLENVDSFTLDQFEQPETITYSDGSTETIEAIIDAYAEENGLEVDSIDEVIHEVID